MLEHRFQNSPGAAEVLPSFEAKMVDYSYDHTFTSTDYSGGSYAALGNYMAEQMIAYGMQDGSNEVNDYVNMNYLPSNSPIILPLDIVDTEIDPNRWQPLAFDYSEVDDVISPESVADFLSPYWGQVGSFALSDDDLEVFEINGADFSVYHNPGAPSYIENSDGDALEDPYKWMHSLVASWSSHLDPSDGVMIDISPASIGNIQSYPSNFEGYQEFYNYEDGGDASIGHNMNPVTGLPYEEQMVPRADYARVLAEFWADGPNSETPPGHWFDILNHVSDNPLLEKRFQGEGDIISDMEWEVKTYLTMGSAMHDVAVSVWGVKCYYDYVRPISAIRYMGNLGQSSDNSLPNYDPHGLPLIPGQFEIIESGDPLAGESDEHVGEMKIKSWRGHDAIDDVETDVAGVDWIRANTWIPYQKFNFVTPPFAGYVSGHSTFSSAAAEVMANVTGDEFFPGGMGTFSFSQNEYLVFEDGPSIDMELQWATYKDASDQ
ncbi:MAG: vanadium-dependent haloperoxidase, partial [Flavobacteriales bacterium]